MKSWKVDFTLDELTKAYKRKIPLKTRTVEDTINAIKGIEVDYMQGKQRRHWCVTLHSPFKWEDKGYDKAGVQEWWERKTELICQAKNLRYVSGQLEISPNTERIHLQLYIEFTDSPRASTVRTRCGGGFAGARRGTRTEARAYTFKQETRLAPEYQLEYGEWRPDDGARGEPSMSDSIIEMILAEKTPAEIAAYHPKAFLHYGRRIKDLYDTREQYRQKYKSLPTHEETGLS